MLAASDVGGSAVVEIVTNEPQATTAEYFGGPTVGMLEGAAVSGASLASPLVPAYVSTTSASQRLASAYASRAGATTYRDSALRLRNANGTFAYDGGPQCKIGGGTHGNTAGSQPAFLYARYDAEGNFLKWGVTQDLASRYTRAELNGGYLTEIREGPRSTILQIEHWLVETKPGPLNHESWAGRAAKRQQ